MHSFVQTKKYDIDQELVDAFISSMYKDLGDIKYENKEDYDAYIYGSAEVVGLMFKRFCRWKPRRISKN